MKWFYTLLLDGIPATMIIIAAVMIVRYIFRKQSRITLNLLWVVLLFRLIVPFVIPSDISMVPKLRDITGNTPESGMSDRPYNNTTDISPDQSNSGIDIPVSRSDNNTVTQANGSASGTTRQDNGSASESDRQANGAASEVDSSGNTSVSSTDSGETGSDAVLDIIGKTTDKTASSRTDRGIYGNAFFYVWLAGVGIMAVVYITQYIMFAVRRRSAEKVYGEKNVYRWNRGTDACAAGILRPRIYIPDNLKDKEYGIILKHEKTHIARHDNVLIFLYYLALTINWFNPLVWAVFLMVQKDIELACDEQVLKDATVEERQDYARTLVFFGSRKTELFTSVAYGKGNLKERVMHIGTEHKRHGLRTVTVLAVLCILGVLSACSSKDKKTSADDEEQITKNSGENVEDTTDGNNSGENVEVTTERLTTEQNTGETPTGYATGMLQEEFIYVDGLLYVSSNKIVNADKIHDEIIYKGQIAKEDSYNYPDEELESTHVPVGTNIYRAGNKIYTSEDQKKYREYHEFKKPDKQDESTAQTTETAESRKKPEEIYRDFKAVESTDIDNEYFSLTLPEEVVGKISYELTAYDDGRIKVTFLHNMSVLSTARNGGQILYLEWRDFTDLYKPEYDAKSSPMYNKHADRCYSLFFGNIDGVYFDQYYCLSSKFESPGGEWGVAYPNDDNTGGYCLFSYGDVRYTDEYEKEYHLSEYYLVYALVNDFIPKTMPQGTVDDEFKAVLQKRYERALAELADGTVAPDDENSIFPDSDDDLEEGYIQQFKEEKTLRERIDREWLERIIEVTNDYYDR
ncbi:Signal transducer regulating beta-lactamase production, contains metallopeptidase domain [Eubacterium ruminantium]|nr:Signal transducer regulating beta-lactamase production, contains metallopeptidase domain [Eubacterium ruminantium]